MAEKTPSPDEVHEKLLDALQDYLDLTVAFGDLRATDYVVAVAGVDLSKADGRVYYATAYTGAPHARLGLVEILTNDVQDGVFGQE